MLENGLDHCTCKKKSCDRFEKCLECIEYHTTRSRRFPLPYCKRELKQKKGLLRKRTAEMKGEPK